MAVQADPPIIEIRSGKVIGIAQAVLGAPVLADLEVPSFRNSGLKRNVPIQSVLKMGLFTD